MHLGNCKANGHEDRFVHQNRRVLRFTNSFSLNKKGLSFDVSKVKPFDPQQQDIWHAYLGYAANFKPGWILCNLQIILLDAYIDINSGFYKSINYVNTDVDYPKY